MPRQQPPDQQQYQKGLNPELLQDEDESEDAEDNEESDLEETSVPPVENDQRLAQSTNDAADTDIEQVEDEEAEDDEDEDEERSHLSQ